MKDPERQGIDNKPCKTRNSKGEILQDDWCSTFSSTIIPFSLLYISRDSGGVKFSICICQVAYQKLATEILVTSKETNF